MGDRAAARIGLDPDGRLPLSQDLAALLDLPAGPVPVDTLAVPAPDAAPTAATPAPVNLNVPPSSVRFMTMPVESLLFEVSQRAVGLGPPDPEGVGSDYAVGVSAPQRRLGEMLHALQYQPGREADLARLRCAGYALHTFFFRYGLLVEQLRRDHPELGEVIPEWSRNFARTAIRLALALPAGEDGLPLRPASLVGPVADLLAQPVEDIVDLLQMRDEVRLREMQIESLRRFMAAIRAPALPDEPRVLGALDSELEGADFAALRRGHLVLVCWVEQLPQVLQSIPAGRLHAATPLRPHALLPAESPRRYTVDYPDRASGTTIRTVTWRRPDASPENDPQVVLVAEIEGAHSYSLDHGATWRATGGMSWAGFDNRRAEAWRQLLADRWHAYNVRNANHRPHHRRPD